MRRLTHFLVLAAFVFSCGGQWYVLQGIAWIKMIHDYSEAVPFTTAVGMTFSGDYPCAICKAIADKKQSQDDKICSIEKFEKKLMPSMAVALLPPAPTSFSYVALEDSFSARTEPPPTPPPRLVSSSARGSLSRSLFVSGYFQD
jgi:hypothetical protein